MEAPNKAKKFIKWRQAEALKSAIRTELEEAYGKSSPILYTVMGIVASAMEKMKQKEDKKAQSPS